VAAQNAGLAAYQEGVDALAKLAARYPQELSEALTPCTEWTARDLASHLICVARWYHGRSWIGATPWPWYDLPSCTITRKSEQGGML
jgi:hypothetical protein